MDRGLPDTDIVKTAVALATRAPSAHNIQPWRWRIGADTTVHLQADPSTQLPFDDPDQRDLILSCGAALHHLRVAFAALGWATVVHRLPNPADPNHLAAIELVRLRPTELDIALSTAICRRRSDRRRYNFWPVPSGHLNLVIERAGALGGVVRRVHGGPWTHLTKAIRISAHRRACGAQYRLDLEPDAAELLVLSTFSDDRLSRLRAGEAVSAALLTATNVGLATCLLTEPLEIPVLRTMVRTKVLEDCAHPQAIIRIGWAPTGADPLPAAPRRPMEELLDWGTRVPLASRIG